MRYFFFLFIRLIRSHVSVINTGSIFRFFQAFVHVLGHSTLVYECVIKLQILKQNYLVSPAKGGITHFIFAAEP